MTDLRVAVDIGGTFTDICILDERSGAIRVAKIASTPDPIDGVMQGLAEAQVDLRDVTLFSHGTTVATNALITRRLPATAMVLTKGFRDVIEIRRGNRQDLWDAYADVAPPYVRRRDRFVVAERTDYRGNVIEALNEDQARQLARILRKRGYRAIAICFMNSYVNPANERRMKEILAQALPGVAISTSSEVLPEIFEHERFSTTVVNAALNPLVGEYALRLSESLKAGGYNNDMLLLHSGGGVMTPKTAARFGARLAGSGIAAGAIASQHIARLCGFENAIGLDMGGTSCDVSLVYRGDATVTKDWYIEFGYPICFPSIEVLTIGAGGGSIAWIDEAGSLHNGPQSAGANPGPACYNQGGDKPTNTDANLILGRLGGGLVGGAIELNIEAAERAARVHTAEPLKISTIAAAKAIISVANANMADAVRVISIRRGYDPRDFALVAFGGAGALHGAALARELAIPVVIVPPNPGITSALGCLLVDIRHDLATTYLTPAAEADTSAIEAELAALELEAIERLAAESVSPENRVLRRFVDMRYQGQWRSLSVPITGKLSSMREIIDAFHDRHEQEYSYRRQEAPVEIYRLNVTAVGVTPKAQLARHDIKGGTLPPPKSTRSVYFDESENAMATPIYKRDTLRAGHVIDGPAIIEQLDSTTVVPPGVRAEIDAWLNIRMQIPGGKQ